MKGEPTPMKIVHWQKHILEALFMKRILLALSLSTLLLSGCGAKDSDNSLPVETNQLSENTPNMEQTEEPAQTDNTEQTEKPAQTDNTEQTEEPAQTDNIEPTEKPAQMDNPGQTEKADISGIYTDKQGTSDVYSQLTLALQPDGTYTAEIGVYRVSQLEGTAVWEGDALRFTSEDPYVLADISVTEGKAEVAFITGAVGFQTGDVYSFPDGAPDKPEEGQAASKLSLSDEIAAEISYAEEQEKEVEKKQGEAVTQMEMNITATEMYQLWDDTLNAVWKLLEANLSEADMEVLRKEEREWIASKEASVREAGLENEGGSLQPLVEAMEAAELTKARVYELQEYAEGK